MACVKPRRGKWVADWRDDDGRRYWKSFDSQEEANIHLGKVAERLKKGIFRRPAALPTFEAVARDWLAEKAGTVRLSTLAGYEVHVDLHLVPELGDLRIDQVRVRHLEVFRRNRLANGLKPQTVNKLLTTATALFDYAMRHEYIDRNPAEVATRCRRDIGEVAVDAEETVAVEEGQVDPAQVLTIEQVHAVIAKADEGLYKTFILTAVMTGARVGELTGLTWADVDLAGAQLHIRRSVSWAKRRGTTETQMRLFKPKTAAGTRTVPMRPELVAALRRWKLACPPTEQGWLFPTENSQPKHRSTIIHKGLHPACDAANVKRVGVHSLRHTFASTLLAAGRTPAEVAKLCGHAGPAVTMRVYAHWLAPGHAADALDSLGAVASGSSPATPTRVTP